MVIMHLQESSLAKVAVKKMQHFMEHKLYDLKLASLPVISDAHYVFLTRNCKRPLIFRARAR